MSARVDEGRDPFHSWRLAITSQLRRDLSADVDDNGNPLPLSDRCIELILGMLSRANMNGLAQRIQTFRSQQRARPSLTTLFADRSRRQEADFRDRLVIPMLAFFEDWMRETFIPGVCFDPQLGGSLGFQTRSMGVHVGGHDFDLEVPTRPIHLTGTPDGVLLYADRQNNIPDGLFADAHRYTTFIVEAKNREALRTAAKHQAAMAEALSQAVAVRAINAATHQGAAPVVVMLTNGIEFRFSCVRRRSLTLRRPDAIYFTRTMEWDDTIAIGNAWYGSDNARIFAAILLEVVRSYFVQFRQLHNRWPC
jgi:hypothetical protein